MSLTINKHDFPLQQQKYKTIFPDSNLTKRDIDLHQIYYADSFSGTKLIMKLSIIELSEDFSIQYFCSLLKNEF